MSEKTDTFKKVLGKMGTMLGRAASATARGLGCAAVAAGKGLSRAASAAAKGISRTTTSTIQATRFKMDEMSNAHQREELIAQLGEAVYGSAKAGNDLPEEALSLVAQITALESEMDTLRTDYMNQKAAAAQQRAAEKVAMAELRAAEKAGKTTHKLSAPIYTVSYDLTEQAPEEPAASSALSAEEQTETEACNAAEAPDAPTLEVPEN